MIRYYTKEAGVRQLERKLGEICRKTARFILEEHKTKVTVTEKNIEKFLGRERYFYQMVNPADEVGIARGLAWTSVGGDTLQIEVNVMNDAPVLARADVGVAMGALGCDAAIEAADVVIMDDSLSKLNLAVRIARKTLRITKENISFSITVKIAVLVLAALGFADMWAAVFADVGVMILAVLNSVRTLRIRP